MSPRMSLCQGAPPQCSLERLVLQDLERPGQGSPALSLCPFAPAERVLELPTEHPSCPPRPEGHLEGQVLVITSVLLGLLLLLLLAWSLAAFFLWAPRGNACCSHCCSQAEAQAPPTASLPYSYLLHPLPQGLGSPQRHSPAPCSPWGRGWGRQPCRLSHLRLQDTAGCSNHWITEATATATTGLGGGLLCPDRLGAAADNPPTHTQAT